MNSEATILLDVGDVELIPAPEIHRLRFGHLRIFVLSVLLGLTIGAVFSVMDPVRSKSVSLELRARITAARVDISAFLRQEASRLRDP